MTARDVAAALERLRIMAAAWDREVMDTEQPDVLSPMKDLALITQALDETQCDAIVHARADLVAWHEWYAQLPAEVRQAHPRWEAAP